ARRSTRRRARRRLPSLRDRSDDPDRRPLQGAVLRSAQHRGRVNGVFIELGGLGEVALAISHHARRPLATAEPDDGATAWESVLIAVTDDEVEHRVAQAETFVIHESRLDGW